MNTSADLSVSKTDSPDPVIAGNNLSYTITVTNAGPSNALGVSLTDVVPTGTSFRFGNAVAGHLRRHDHRHVHPGHDPGRRLGHDRRSSSTSIRAPSGSEHDHEHGHRNHDDD